MSRRILLLEDDDALREELDQFLTRHGMAVAATGGIDYARVLLKRQKFDLVLTDLWVGQESGFDILLHAHTASGTPCLVMTAQDRAAEAASDLPNATCDFIMKPIDANDLLMRITALIAPAHGRLLARFWKSHSGAVSILAALSLAVLVAIAALVIDTGSLYFARRNLQAATDAAALAAVQNPASANAIATSVFESNGYDAPVLTVTPGTYNASEAIAAQGRFTPSSTATNAVRVSAAIQQSTYFGGFFGLGRDRTLVTQAVAARLPNASFGVGTALAQLNAGILNTVLGQLWGSSVNLSLIDYQALVTTNVMALPFLNHLAADIGVGGSYQQLAGASVTIGQVLSAMAETITSSSGAGNPSGSLLAIKSLQVQLGNAAPMLLSNIIDLSPLAGRSIGGVVQESGTALTVNLMSLITASARTVAAGRLINLGTAVAVPVTNSAISTRLAVGNQMVQVALAAPGTTVHTAQVRLALLATLTSINLGVATATVQVPIYLEAASGQATLNSLPCTSGGDRAWVSATSGLTTLRFGTVTDAALGDFSTPVTPNSVPVVNVTLLGIPVQVSISGSINIAANGPALLDFTKEDIAAGTVKAVPSGSSAPFQLLSSSFALSTNVAGVALLSTLVNSLLSALNPIITGLIAPLDAPVAQLMATLGLGLGTANVRVFDVQCKTPTLVG